MVRFDGYGAERNVLLDAKDWKKYPPGRAAFWQEEVIKQASLQLSAAQGVAIEWHFSAKESLDLVREILKRERLTGITVVLTPETGKDALP